MIAMISAPQPAPPAPTSTAPANTSGSEWPPKRSSSAPTAEIAYMPKITGLRPIRSDSIGPTKAKNTPAMLTPVMITLIAALLWPATLTM